jgi:hypothetical protein
MKSIRSSTLRVSLEYRLFWRSKHGGGFISVVMSLSCRVALGALANPFEWRPGGLFKRRLFYQHLFQALEGEDQSLQVGF